MVTICHWLPFVNVGTICHCSYHSSLRLPSALVILGTVVTIYYCSHHLSLWLPSVTLITICLCGYHLSLVSNCHCGYHLSLVTICHWLPIVTVVTEFVCGSWLLTGCQSGGGYCNYLSSYHNDWQTYHGSYSWDMSWCIEVVLSMMLINLGAIVLPWLPCLPKLLWFFFVSVVIQTLFVLCRTELCHRYSLLVESARSRSSAPLSSIWSLRCGDRWWNEPLSATIDRDAVPETWNAGARWHLQVVWQLRWVGHLCSSSICFFWRVAK